MINYKEKKKKIGNIRRILVKRKIWKKNIQFAVELI